MGENKDIILYQGSPLERIAASEILLAKDKPLIEKPRYYLASDVIVGKYGVTGFVLVDTKPEDRWISYTDGFKIGVEWGENDALVFFTWKQEDPNRLSHYINTSQGFKMVRYFILPSNLKEFFAQDKILGEPFIDKCCLTDTLPEEFDEVKVNPAYAFNGEERELIDRIIASINPSLQQIGEDRFSWEDFGHHVYFSFHPWQHYKPVIEVGEEAVVRSIGNFDNLLSRFDEKKKLQKRELEIDGAKNYEGMLPSSD